MASVLSCKHFHDEKAAYAYVEARVWANGRVCPHCGTVDNSTKLKGVSTRPGVYKCKDCRKPFTVKVGTVFEGSNVKLQLWLQAIYLTTSSKKGISANQLHRTLGVTLKTAWFMAHRVREAMRSGELAPFGSDGGPSRLTRPLLAASPVPRFGRLGITSAKCSLWWTANPAAPVARSFDHLSAATVTPILTANIVREARLMTYEAQHYKTVGLAFADHGIVRHTRDEYVSPDDASVHTNTIESYFSIFKRGMKGVYRHCAKRHLHRYMAEFDSRYSNRIALGVDDQDRAALALVGAVGKRLRYRDSSASREALV